MHTIFLTISIVIFEPDEILLIKTLDSLYNSCNRSKIPNYKIFIINNGKKLPKNNIYKSYKNLEILDGHGNIGYGSGHNLIINNLGKYHLILNPDVILHEDSILKSIERMEKDFKIGLITPNTFDNNNKRQYILKSYPSVFIFFLRSLNNKQLNKIFKSKLDRYELNYLDYDNLIKNIKFCGGCFMFFRGKNLNKLNGFDHNFFMYFEDMDLSFRSYLESKNLYDPNVKITHYGGGASRKNLKHWKYFIFSLIVFFRKFGWKFF